jgi:hypothetical protein
LATIPWLDAQPGGHNGAALSTDPSAPEEDNRNGEHNPDLPEGGGMVPYNRPGNHQDSPRCSDKDWQELPLSLNGRRLKDASGNEGKRQGTQEGHDERLHSH